MPYGWNRQTMSALELLVGLVLVYVAILFSCHKVASSMTTGEIHQMATIKHGVVPIFKESLYLSQFNSDLYETLNLSSWGTT